MRLDTMSALIVRLAAVELLCAAQAVDLRGTVAALGAGTSNAYGLVRRHLPAGDLTVDGGERLDAARCGAQDEAEPGPSRRRPAAAPARRSRGPNRGASAEPEPPAAVRRRRRPHP